uniref:hypothetical protein RF1 n=1 Tax=Dicranostigma leptopodum TaxID=56851 RepID=UPI0021143A8E|nr:hypothetical protein RF1 [Dicranostigma leptopodum]USN94353.1 hypothetical protein RF1 [Dicranostigma leptopodum]
MIFKSFILGNLVSLCMRIINSAAVVGLYYGFLTAFSIGPSYILLLQARVMEKGTEKEVSAITGFLMGRLMMFISIYYAPLHLALGRPHTITFLVLPYLLFQFFWSNRIDYGGSTTRNSMRNLSIQCVFLNNLIFQLVNQFVFSNSALARLVNISMFRCNNKMLFVTSSFVGWLIGHILFMQGVGLVLFWIRQNNYIRSNRYLAAELRNSIARSFSILLLFACACQLSRMPVPDISTSKLKETEETETEETETEETEERDVEIERISETKGTKKNTLPLVTLLFDYGLWHHTLPYIDDAIRNEMSQYFFYTCQSDGKQRISFTYPPSLSTFLEMLKGKMLLRTTKGKMLLRTTEKLSSEELYNHWIYTNEQKKNSLKNALFNRIDALKRRSLMDIFFLKKRRYPTDVLEKRTRLCNEKTKQECLPEKYDPFLNGPYRGTIQKGDSHSSMNMDKSLIVPTKNSSWRNKLHRKYLFNFNAVTTGRKDQTIRKEAQAIGRKEIRKKIHPYRFVNEDKVVLAADGEIDIEDPGIFLPRGKNIVVLQDMVIPSLGESLGEVDVFQPSRHADFRRYEVDESIRAKRRKVVSSFWYIPWAHPPLFLDRIRGFYAFFYYFDVYKIMHLNLIFKNWMREGKNWMRKGKSLMRKGTEFKISDSEEKKKKERNKIQEFKDEEARSIELEEMMDKAIEEEVERREKVVEFWDNFTFGLAIRAFMLLFHSYLRRYIIQPSLIIAKNIGRILLFQSPEWHEDWREWRQETHVFCVYTGIEFSETKFPKNWFQEGFHIKILFPFRLKPWHSSQDQDRDSKNARFLTVCWGMDTDRPYGFPQPPRLFFFKLVFKAFKKELKKKVKELKKKVRKMKKKKLLAKTLRVLKEKTKRFLKVSIGLFRKRKMKERKRRMKERKRRMKELVKVNPTPSFGLREVDELSENPNGKNSITRINNQIIHESSSPIRSVDWTNYSLTENKMKDLADRTSRIRNQIEKITNDKQKFFLIPDMNISPNETSCDDKNKRLESPKNFWEILKILKRRGARLIRKRHSFMKFWIEKIYMDTLLYLINISRINVQPFLDLKKKYLNKYSYNDEINENRMHLISTIKKSLSNISKKNSQKYSRKVMSGLFSLSQAYVFYKLSQQTHVISKDHWRSVLQYIQYPEKSLFCKDRIKGFFAKPRPGINVWKNWLNSHFSERYYFSPYILKNWRQAHQSKNKREKLYRYNRLLYQYITCEEKYNRNIYKSKFSLFPRGLSIPYWLGDHFNKKQNPKYFNPRKYVANVNVPIFGVFFRIEYNLDGFFLEGNRVDIFTWVNRTYGTYKNTLDKNLMFKKDRSYQLPFFETPKIQTKRSFFDWMGLNEEILNKVRNFPISNNEEILNKAWNFPISNLDPWFFPEFLGLYDAYRIRPWASRIKLLLFHFNGNQNIKRKKKKDQEDLGSGLPNQQKAVKEDFDYRKPGPRNLTLLRLNQDLDFVMRRHLISNIDVDDDFYSDEFEDLLSCCFLLKASKPKEVLKSYIKRGDVCPNMTLSEMGLSTLAKHFVEKGVMTIDPVRPSIKWDGQFIMYQTIAISLTHKSKNRKYRDKYDFLVPENISSPRRRREWRIQVCLNSENMNVVDRNKVFCNGNNIRNCGQFTDTNKFMKSFLWPNFRLEDLACMNRYWFDTSNGSRFSMSRIYMYPRYD